MKRIPILAISALFASSIAFASGDHKGHSAAPAASPITAQAAQPAGAMTEGEVRKIDKEQGKITLKHGEIKNLDMPGMTMVFRVKDAALLDKVKEGDKIGFTAEKIGGNYTVTGIEKK